MRKISKITSCASKNCNISKDFEISKKPKKLALFEDELGIIFQK